MYSMYDTEGRGDSGGMSLALSPNGCVQSARPKVGTVMRVGALHTTMFGDDTWWQTNLITEIIEDTPNKVVFKTKSGSIYTWEIK